MGGPALDLVSGSIFGKKQDPLVLPRGLPARTRRAMQELIETPGAGHLEQVHVPLIQRLVETRQRLADAYAQLDVEGLTVTKPSGTVAAHPLVAATKAMEGTAVSLERQLCLTASARQQNLAKSERERQGEVWRGPSGKPTARPDLSGVLARLA
jgi:P27 family predicted phage terminase small subunit